MAAKNDKRRNEILACAYRKFSENGYDNVSLGEIAAEVGISKSLMQRYYPKKIMLIETFVEDLLTVTFEYIYEARAKYTNPLQRISDYTLAFYHMGDSEKRLASLLKHLASNAAFVDVWTKALADKLKTISEEMNLPYLNILNALYFSIGGTLHLCQHMDELGLDYWTITKTNVQMALLMMGIDNKNVEDLFYVSEHGESKINANDMLAFCKEHIEWLK